MARRRKRRALGGLGSTTCRIPSDLPKDRCATEKGVTFCVGDRVKRADIKGPGPGTVLAVHSGANNSGRKKMAARVCWDRSEPGEVAYPFLFGELKKARS